MAKNYKVTQSDGLFQLVENSQQLVIAEGSRERIRNLANRLNGGTGFRGFTPPFFVKQRFDADSTAQKDM